ncbi:MAG: fatty acid hydroxylase [Hydrocarboniphaga sp.]|uniref:sterol desaturase family protein n=1 Tax=Hydrocarboniphaga sp. TaxID=2033016 RepID=UPI00261C31B6|nr:sterol desaturase family protein [Hydrocarboniphaga sp.]MDB5971224.1 fatty acid hydroxylase [Hydrocarboniphaga sp.]
MKVLFQLVFPFILGPLFWLAFIGLAALLIGTLGLSLLWLPALFAAALACIFAAETALPYQRDWNRSRADRSRDAVHAIVNEAMAALSLAAIPQAAAFRPYTSLWPDRWPFALQLLMAIVVADFGITLVHWLSHRWPWLWRLHCVHHSVTRLYGLNGLMKHPLHQVVEALAGVAPLLLLGMPIDVAAVLAYAIAIQLLLQHANLDLRLGVLRQVFAWAPLHRFHHIRYGVSGDVNFGLFFTFWDRHLLGTAFDGNGYRLASDDLGIGARPDYPAGYVAQLIEPFRCGAIEAPTPALPAGLRGRR